MGGGAANLDIGTVGFENPGHRVLATPVVIVVVIIVVIPVTHPLVVVLTVSHVLPLLPALECLPLSWSSEAVREMRTESPCSSSHHRSLPYVAFNKDAFPNC
jgi:hypothetical protein